MGRAHHYPKRSYNFLVLGASASIMGRSFQSTWLRPFTLPRSYAAIIDAPLLEKREKGWSFAGTLRPFFVLCHAPNVPVDLDLTHRSERIIPDDMAIPLLAHLALSGRREVTRTAATMIQSTLETWTGSIRAELDADGTYRVFTGSKYAARNLVAPGNVNAGEV